MWSTACNSIHRGYHCSLSSNITLHNSTARVVQNHISTHSHALKHTPSRIVHQHLLSFIPQPPRAVRTVMSITKQDASQSFSVSILRVASPAPPEIAESEVNAAPWKKVVVQWDISHNSISLAFFAFTMLMQIAAFHFKMPFFFQKLGEAMFYMSCTVLLICIFLTICRTVIFPSSLCNDFRHPRLVSLFFIPVISGSLCLLTTPDYLRSVSLYTIGFYILGTYQIGLSLFLFGEWLIVAHPSYIIYPLVFMQTIGFFLLTNIAAAAHMLDQAYAMFSIGCLFWLLVLITNFQHVSRILVQNTERPQPTFFLFIAPPAQAAIAFTVLTASSMATDKSELVKLLFEIPWTRVADGFFDIDLYLYLLMFRLLPNFWNVDFTFAWWAYVFPLSASACTAILKYAQRRTIFWKVLSWVLTVIASLSILIVMSFTVWAIYTGRAPRNKESLSAYNRYLLNKSTGSNVDYSEEQEN